MFINIVFSLNLSVRAGLFVKCEHGGLQVLRAENKSEVVVCQQFPPEECKEEVEVDSEGDQLGVDKRQGNPGVGDQCVVATSHICQVLFVLPRVRKILFC